ncbi:amidohydrolase [Amphritea sp. HPY]|uniref:amidohydrolase n=1 Tax=Amphritea sp. HPY TaxID=3421652 RepID=UPI003D7EC051
MVRFLSSKPLIAGVLSLLIGSYGQAAADESADTIYRNGAIVTLNATNDIAQAVAVKDGNIVAVGSDQEIDSLKGDRTRVVELQGKTLIPGFYDAHSHIVATGIIGLFQVNLNSPPIGQIKTIDDIVALLQSKALETPEGEWIQGFGYDDTLLAEGRHPTRYDLDRASTKHPIEIRHVSGHLTVANTLALELAGISADTPQPEGGVIRKDDVGKPTGILDEAPATDIVTGVIPPMAPQKYFTAINYAANLYAAKGVTTANDGAASMGLVSLLKAASEQPGLLPIRVNAWPTADAAEAAYALELKGDKLSLGGTKEFADGSIQAYTGYLSQPYHTAFHGDEDYKGFSRHDREVLAAKILKIHRSGKQVMIHTNGDAAIDDALYGFSKAQQAFPRDDARHVLIHTQMAREDQLDRMSELGIIPSFFELHTYYWGDRHSDIFMGPERAARMSPTRSAVQRGIRFTLHADTPVVPMDPMLMIWSAVSRTSTSGRVIGAEQTITPLQALRATTIDAAYQNFEEKVKGSVEVGKLADFAILSSNPLTVKPGTIKDIQVLETIVGDKRVYPLNK